LLTDIDHPVSIFSASKITKTKEELKKNFKKVTNKHNQSSSSLAETANAQATPTKNENVHSHQYEGFFCCFSQLNGVGKSLCGKKRMIL
jgi:hypothetical protein